MDKDTSGIVVERASISVARVQERMKRHFGIGPGNVRMSPEDIQRMFDKMQPDDRLRFANSVGIEKFLQMMQGVNNA